jgi:hypothetical protein
VRHGTVRHDDPGATRERRRTVTAVVLLAPVLAVVIATYAFFISAGFSSRPPPSQRYYDMLADAFLAKQLHLRELPERELLEQADPYDYKTSHRLWKLWDASLYDGKYYFYWGPLPALVIAGMKVATGHETIVTDRTVVFVCNVGRLLVGAILFSLVWRWLFPHLSVWTPAVALLVFGLANPYLYELGRPGIYEAAIDSAQLFLLSGLLAAFVATHGCRDRRRELLLVATAGWCWGATLACRISLLFAVAALVPLTALLVSLREPWCLRRFAIHFTALAAPVAVVLLALGSYNYARFGSFVDFGTSYMLTGKRYAPKMSMVLPNLEAYVFRRFDVSCRFPYVSTPFFARHLTPAWVRPDSGYVPKEPLVGLLFGIPGIIFAVPAVARAATGFVRGTSRPSLRETDLRVDRLSMACLVGGAAIIVLFAGIPTLGVWFSSMRYLSDVTSGALILAIVGFLTCLPDAHSRAGRCRARGVALLGATLATYTIVVSVLLGFQGGYFRVIEKRNRALHEKLQSTLSFCDAEAAPGGQPRTGRDGRPASAP